MPYNYKLTIAYDGTDYCGWQVQPNGTSIQEVLQQKLAILLKQKTALQGSGRTDAGVHAMGQAANFHSPRKLDERRFLHSLNALLPHDIRILAMKSVAASFHAQHSAKGKTYFYHLHLNPYHSPFTNRYRLHVRNNLDITALKQASRLFVGTHDFTSFANEAHSGSASCDAIRTLHRLDIQEQEGGVRLEFEGDGFLYKMVRNITGTLLEIASGKDLDIAAILAAKDRRTAGMAAPPHGLFLMHVDYMEESEE